jgi:hypothetical protein
MSRDGNASLSPANDSPCASVARPAGHQAGLAPARGSRPGAHRQPVSQLGVPLQPYVVI